MVIPGLMVSINEAIPPACRTHSNQSLRTLSVRIQAKERKFLETLAHAHTNQKRKCSAISPGQT